MTLEKVRGVELLFTLSKVIRVSECLPYQAFLNEMDEFNHIIERE